MFACLCVGVGIEACGVFMCVGVGVCVHVCGYVRDCGCRYVSVCTCVHVCVCSSVRTCLNPTKPQSNMIHIRPGSRSGRF